MRQVVQTPDFELDSSSFATKSRAGRLRPGTEEAARERSAGASPPNSGGDGKPVTMFRRSLRSEPSSSIPVQIVRPKAEPAVRDDQVASSQINHRRVGSGFLSLSSQSSPAADDARGASRLPEDRERRIDRDSLYSQWARGPASSSSQLPARSVKLSGTRCKTALRV